MRAAFERLAVLVPVSDQAGSRLAGFPAGEAEQVGRAEGKMK